MKTTQYTYGTNHDEYGTQLTCIRYARARMCMCGTNKHSFQEKIKPRNGSLAHLKFHIVCGIRRVLSGCVINPFCPREIINVCVKVECVETQLYVLVCSSV